MTPLQEAIKLAEGVVREGETMWPTGYQIARALLSLHAAEQDAREKEWAVVFTFLYGHPGKRVKATPLIFLTEREADDCIAGKLDCGPWREREPEAIQKLWRYAAGPWQDAAMSAKEPQ